MFSQLGPLFKTQFRQTESNDTRQHIPHEERDQHRKKDNEDTTKNKESDLWTDDTTVSVTALRAFLIEFLKTIPGGDDTAFIKEHTQKEDAKSRPREQTRPTNTHNARAVRAYQTMASHAGNEIDIEKDIKEKNNEPTADKLLSKELRDIHALILDLEYIENKGVRMLNILKANSFVESLTIAVALEKLKFK